MTDPLMISEKLKEYISSSDQPVEFSEHEPLKKHTSFLIGGDADIYAMPETVEGLTELIRFLRDENIPFYILGKGSNILASDSGYRGVIVSTLKLTGITVKDNILTAGCGDSLASCCIAARDAGLSGMEQLYGIPGSVGGAVYMNAGAYGQEMKDVVIRTRYLDLDDMTVKTVEGEAHGFGYRTSFFRTVKCIILSTQMELTKRRKILISEDMKTVHNKRAEKQPLEFPSAGSVFKRYPGRYTAEMIDQCGLKGATVGGAQVSEKHAGFIINRGGAKSADVDDLIKMIQEKVKEKFEIDIECEVIRLGDFDDVR